MAEKTLQSRIIQKHDTAANWALATNFIPKLGEIIIYDADDNNSKPKIKIGNGIDKVSDLEFFSSIGNAQGVYYIEGTGTTAGTWLGSHEDIKEYYPGLSVLYKIPIAGASTTKLNINNLGAVSVVKNVNTAISTSYAVNSIVNLIYTLDGTTAYWKIADYDTNTRNSAGTTNKVDTKLFLVGAASQSSYVTTYSNANVYIDTDNSLYSNGKKVATVDVATTSADGLMSSTDKTKLDGIDTGANKTVVDTALNSTSTNPVQNKVINSAISAKQNTITGAATTVTDSNLTASRALVSNSSGKIAVSAVTSTELGYLDGVTSAIQTQLNAKVPTSRTINGKALTGNITLTASDVGIDPDNISESVLAEAKTYTDNKITGLKGANSGLAELDANGKVPSSQLPSYVDDVLEYANLAGFPATGESGKIYIAQDTNKSYRWSGSAYAEISSSLALGETSSTAYRGDRGAAAYKHAVTNKGIAKSSGLYKITTNSEGHVTAATAVAKADITGLGIPAQDTTYNAATQSAAGLMSAADKTKLDGITANADTVAFAQNATSGNKVGTITINGTATDMYSPTQTSVSGNAGTATTLKTARTIDGVSFNGSAAITHYGECSTAAATVAKTVALTGFTLATGARIAVKFTVTNTASNPTLNVNSTGAKAIMYRGSVISKDYLAASRVYEFVYDGTDWELIGDINTDTNTKVTSAANHYTPAEDTSAALSVDASSTTAATWNSTSLVTGVNLARDAKGHVVGVTVDSIKMPANPNSNTTYTLSGAASGNTWVTTLTPSSGTATTSTVPAATSSAAGLMSAADKTKLDGITEGTVEQARSTSSSWRTLLSHYTATTEGTNPGETTNKVYYNEAISIQPSTGTLRATAFKGSGASLTSLNASNISSGTIAAARLPAATTSAQGAMTTDMVTKLNGIETGANKYSLPTASSSTLGGVKIGSGVTISSGVISVTASGIGAAPTSHASTATTYGVASASNYGHAMASSTTPKALGTAAVGSETAKFARGDHVHALPALTSCTGTLTVAKGGTGATTATDARENLLIKVSATEPTSPATGTIWIDIS